MIKNVVCEELGFRQVLDGNYTPEQIREALSNVMPTFRNVEYEVVNDELHFRISTGDLAIPNQPNSVDAVNPPSMPTGRNLAAQEGRGTLLSDPRGSPREITLTQPTAQPGNHRRAYTSNGAFRNSNSHGSAYSHRSRERQCEEEEVHCSGSEWRWGRL